MKGAVINKSTMWLHAMKRAVAPGGKIPLDELYDQYGKKHDIKKGKDFIEWLRNVKLRDNKNWQIILEEAKDVKTKLDEVKGKVEDAAKEQKLPEPIELRRIDIEKLDIKHMSIADVVSLSVRQAREVIPRVSDIKLLKYSLQEANPLSGKDSLCRILRKRISELETIRR